MATKTKVFFILFSFVLLAIACQHKKTETIVLESWEDGKPRKEIEYIIEDDGKKTPYKETSYHQNEEKFIEGTYDKKQERDGKWTSWFDDGKKNSQGYYKNGKLHGEYTVWYPNEKIHYTGQYKNGEQTGNWKFYDEKGNLLRELEF
ncbi:MAG: hypothetical protein GX330_03910 [Bacteroidales bacterium]|nr:hypothetical protein [Bacteroidales bacterium]